MKIKLNNNTLTDNHEKLTQSSVKRFLLVSTNMRTDTTSDLLRVVIINNLKILMHQMMVAKPVKN